MSPVPPVPELFYPPRYSVWFTHQRVALQFTPALAMFVLDGVEHRHHLPIDFAFEVPAYRIASPTFDWAEAVDLSEHEDDDAEWVWDQSEPGMHHNTLFAVTLNAELEPAGVVRFCAKLTEEGRTTGALHARGVGNRYEGWWHLYDLRGLAHYFNEPQLNPPPLTPTIRTPHGAPSRTTVGV